MANCKCDSCPVSGSLVPQPRARRLRLPLAGWVFIIVAVGVLIIDALEARAEVYHSRESALELAFPDADSVTTRTLMLTADEAERIAAKAGARLPSRLVQVYEAWSGYRVVARGIIDTHDVRSLPETLFIVVDPSNRVEAVHLLAFHEPVQYRAPGKWFAQFEDQALDRELAVRRDIAGIAGATMTSNAITAAVRRALATLAVGFGENEPEARVQGDGQSDPTLTGK